MKKTAFTKLSRRLSNSQFVCGKNLPCFVLLRGPEQKLCAAGESLSFGTIRENQQLEVQVYKLGSVEIFVWDSCGEVTVTLIAGLLLSDFPEMFAAASANVNFLSRF